MGTVILRAPSSRDEIPHDYGLVRKGSLGKDRPTPDWPRWRLCKGRVSMSIGRAGRRTRGGWGEAGCARPGVGMTPGISVRRGWYRI